MAFRHSRLGRARKPRCVPAPSPPTATSPCQRSMRTSLADGLHSNGDSGDRRDHLAPTRCGIASIGTNPTAIGSAAAATATTSAAETLTITSETGPARAALHPFCCLASEASDRFGEWCVAGARGGCSRCPAMMVCSRTSCAGSNECSRPGNRRGAAHPI